MKELQHKIDNRTTELQMSVALPTTLEQLYAVPTLKTKININSRPLA